MSRGKRIKFFATKMDLTNALNCKEIFGEDLLKYIKNVFYTDEIIPEYHGIDKLPPKDQKALSDYYLVT